MSSKTPGQGDEVSIPCVDCDEPIILTTAQADWIKERVPDGPICDDCKLPLEARL